MSILRSVLVADDEASLRHVLTLVLQQQGYEVRAVSNGEEALAELEARDYDAVVSDVRMPRVDGLTLLKKALARQPDLTFVVMQFNWMTIVAVVVIVLAVGFLIMKT